ncbi:MAG: Lrp/AsnC family transcriptional regulator [Candidatus Methylomirabilales bacterium]
MPVSAFVFIECAMGRAKGAAREIARVPGVKLAHAVTGNYDVIAFVEAADLEALGTTVVSKIQAVSGVQRTTTNVVVE